MNITKEQIKKLMPCSDGYQWYLDHGSLDLTETLLDVNKVKSEWARWLYTRLMTPKQQKQFAIYAAEEVLHIFEARFPNDDRPRLAIVAAKKALKSNTKANREAARDAGTAAAAGASDAARDAAYAGAAYATYAVYVSAVYASAAAAAAGAAASAASYAAGAAGAYGAYGAYAAAADAAAAIADTATTACASIAMQEKLIRKAVKLLEKQ